MAGHTVPTRCQETNVISTRHSPHPPVSCTYIVYQRIPAVEGTPKPGSILSHGRTINAIVFTLSSLLRTACSCPRSSWRAHRRAIGRTHRCYPLDPYIPASNSLGRPLSRRNGAWNHAKPMACTIASKPLTRVLIEEALTHSFPLLEYGLCIDNRGLFPGALA